MTEIEMRVLRGFIVSREDTASGAKTLVLRTSGLFEDSKALWRDPYSNILEHEWRGPGSEAIRVICDDLFVEEVRGKALSATNDPEAVRTPLSAEMLKKSRLRGRLPGEENTGADGIEEELRWMWENLSKETQEAIALLSWSDSEWKFEELANTLGWNHALVSTTAASLRDSYVLDFRFEVSVEVIRISDWVTKECLSRISLSQVSRSRLRSIVTNIQRLGLHVDDLGLATSILQGGELPLAMLLSAVPVAIQEGRYEQILDLRRSLIPFKLEANPKESLWRQFSSAAHRLGNLPLEITLLEELIPWSREADARMKLELQRAEALASLGDWEGSVSVCEVIERTATDRYLKVRACLQRAEALWQSGNHDGATKAYEETKARLLPEMREEWLRYTIGRARQYGQIGRMKDVAAFLEEARRGVGESSCNANPLFLHTLGGLQLQTAEYRGARATLIKAMEIARSNENWKEFLMISMRAGSVESGLGNPRRAAELGREGLSISQALGSETITARVLASLAHAEMYLGKLGSAVRHSHQYLDTAVRKKDKTMEIQAHRLLAQIGAHGGFENLLHTSLSYLRKSSSKNDDIEAQARADLCQGIFYWGCGRYSEAAGALELAVNHFVEVGWKDDELEARLWLLRVQSELGRDVSGELVHLEAAIREAKSRLLCPLLSLLQIKLGVSDAVSAETIAEELWGNGRIMDVMEWLPDLGPAHGKALDRILLGAIQSTAESLVQPDLRRQFLSFPRTLAALRQIRD
jgi:tetratricopeptide (TPR) repeat protein